MHQNTPRPPLLQRLPPGAWTVLTWCAVAGFALVLFATMAHGPAPVRPYARPPLEGAARAVVAVAMAVPLGWARLRPSPVLAVLLAEVAAVIVLRGRTEQIWPLYLTADVLVCFITATRSRRAGIVAAAVTLAVQEAAGQVGLYLGGGNPLAPGFIAVALLLGLTVLVAWMAGTSIRQRREYDEALRAQAAVQAVTAERLRIARELHDMVAHSIGIIAIQAGAGRRVIDAQPAQARDALSAIESASRETLKGLRQVLGVLRQTESEPVEPGLAGLDRLAATTTAAGVRVDVRRQGERRSLPRAIDQSAFRIIQESVTNVVRHAGTRNCQVSLDYRGDELRIEVVDDGRGGAVEGAGVARGGATERAGGGVDAGGYGISGMRERVALLDGDFSAGPRPEGGFRVAARLPVPTEAR
ncbi:histidine kinase [Nonomuraea sp. NPDC005983]|uniref:sensor histidine kinase n=1 Tax=Nonomuraea sp. NPDC005983 TaxID=3155595 RepID=UPI0033AD44BC